MDEGDRMSTLRQSQRLNDIHSKCGKCVRGDQEGIKGGREEEKGKRETKNKEQRTENEAKDAMKWSSFQERTVGEKEKAERGWINDPEKEVIRDT
jgi:hypothetical protein